MAKKSAQEWLRSPADTDSASGTLATDAATISTNWQTALFPSSLLCFLQFLIDSVTITDCVSEPLPAPYPNWTGVSESTKASCTSGDQLTTVFCLSVCLYVCLYICL